jgi:hypothetical protein
MTEEEEVLFLLSDFIANFAMLYFDCQSFIVI